MLKNPYILRDGAKADNSGNVYFIATPLLMDDVKPGVLPAVTKGVVYYIDVDAKTVSVLPSTVGTAGFAAVSLSTAKSTGAAGTCVVGIGFLRSKIEPLQNSGNSYGSKFAESYDYMVATPKASVASLILTALSQLSAAEVARLVPSIYYKYGAVDLTVGFMYAANIVMGSSSGDPLLYTFFRACKTGVSDCSQNFITDNPYGQLLLGIRANLNPATGALSLLCVAFHNHCAVLPRCPLCCAAALLMLCCNRFCDAQAPSVPLTVCMLREP